MYETLEEEFTRGGGEVAKRITIRGEYSVDEVLGEAEAAALKAVDLHGFDGVSVQLVGGVELASLVVQADNYPTLYNLTWFGCEWTAENEYFMLNATESTHLKILSTVPVPHPTSSYLRLNERYEWIFCEPISFEAAATYDAAWIAAQAILAARTTDAEALLQVIPDVAAETYGASGWCRLNNDGDRYTSDYSIKGYAFKQGRIVSIEYGRYDSELKQVTWIHEDFEN